MLALLLDGAARLVADYPRPHLVPGEAVIQVSLAGVCATDLEMIRGYRPGFKGPLGHEFVGVVVEAAAQEWLGRRVVGEINIGCGTCDLCRQGIPTQCRVRSVLGIAGRDGAFAEYLALPLRNLHLLPEGTPDEVAVFVEPLAAACQVLSLLHVRPETRAVVMGDGKLGLLTAQVLALSGAQVTVIGHHPAKLRLAADWGMVTKATEADYEVVVDCTGDPAAMQTALELVRPRGTIVLKSTYVSTSPVDLSRVVVDEIRLLGSRCGPFEPALRLLTSGRVDIRPLIEAIYPLHDGLAALEHANRRGALKILIRP